MNDCSLCAVRNRAICASLDNDEIQALGALGRKQKVFAGQPLIWEGDESIVVANVIGGVFKMAVNASNGKEQIVGIAFPSDFIGRPFGAQNQYSVIALTDGEICVFNSRSFESFAREHPELEHKLLSRTLVELDGARRWMQLLGRKSAEEKMATFLLEMSKKWRGRIVTLFNRRVVLNSLSVVSNLRTSWD